jgi:hypothetical protein
MAALRVVEDPLIGFNDLQGGFERDWRSRLVGAVFLFADRF